MIRFLSVALIGLIFSCCSQKTVITGTYVRKFETLKLNNDSTYQYMYRVEWPQSASKGTWEKVDEKVIELNSFYDLEKLPIEVSEGYDKTSKGSTVVKIHLEGSIDASLFKAIRFSLLLEGVEVIRQASPVLSIPTEEFSSMKVVVSFVSDKLPIPYAIRKSVTSEEYKVKSVSSNTFDISIPFEAEMLYSETVKNHIIKLKGSKLYWLSKGKPYFKKN